MAIRMQQRRGTAEQWELANPVLAAGEIGFETDTNQFKLGDGVNRWEDLSYFVNVENLSGELEGYIPDSEKGEPLGVATLDEEGKVPSSQLPDIDEISQDAIDAALTAGTGILKDYDDEANTITLEVDTDIIATKEYVDGAEAAAIAAAALDATDKADAAEAAAIAAAALDATDKADAAEAAAIAAAALDATDKADAAEAAAIAAAEASAASIYAPLSGATFTGTVTLSADPTQALQATTKQYTDSLAAGIVAKPQVLGATTANIDATYNNGTAGVGATLTHNVNGVFPAEAGGAAGWAVGKGILVKNQTNKAENGRYFVSDMGSESTPYVLTRCSYCDEADEIPGAYIFVQEGTNKGTGWIQVVDDAATFVVGTDDINVFQFSGAGAFTAGNGLNLDGTQFSIDTEITATKDYVDGEISGIDLSTKQDVVEGVSSTEIGYLDGVTSSIQTQLNDKAPLNSPTFTGNVDFSNATVTGIETGGGTANDDTILKAALFFGGN
jgi:hypothetical protein